MRLIRSPGFIGDMLITEEILFGILEITNLMKESWLLFGEVKMVVMDMQPNN